MSSTLPKSRYPRVAFFVHEIEGEFSELLYRGIEDAAKDMGVNLLIFPGKSLKSTYGYQINYNIIYDLIQENNIDGLITASTLFSFLSKEEMSNFFLKFDKIPVISVGIPIDGIPSILINDSSGLREGLNHLIKFHGRKKIAFIQGPPSFTDAKVRYSVYLDVLKDNGIDLDPELVYPGDFTQYSAIKAVQAFVDERKVTFDALAAANDEMALFAMKALQERNINIPQDVSIIGFDNVGDAAKSNPSLTTVKQPVYLQVYTAMEKLLEMINHQKKVGNVILDTRLIIRESCGCLSETLKSIKTENPGKHCNENNKCIVHDSAAFEREIWEFVPEGVNAESMKSFINKSFEAMTGETIEFKSVITLVNQFKSAIKTDTLAYDDIFKFQTLITKLRDKLLFLTDESNKNRIDDFFHVLRFQIMDSIHKKQSRRWNSHYNDIIHLRKVLNNMISNISSKNALLKSIIHELKSLGVRSCYFFLYDKSIIYNKNHQWNNPGKLRLEMAFNQDNILNTSEQEIEVKWEELINNDFLPQDRRYTILVNPIFSNDEHLGIILCEFCHEDKHLFESIVIEISSALKLSNILNNRRQIEEQLKDAMDKLESYNQKLSDLSQTDELTGLYNRRGFLNMARPNLFHAKRMGKSGFLFFGDLDGLKAINDNYGHDEGDKALKAIAEALKKTFMWTDIIGRLGGDEFIIFTVNMSSGTASRLQKKLELIIKDYNDNSKLPYSLSISMGAVQYKSSDNMTIEDLIANADTLLYNKKREKRGV